MSIGDLWTARDARYRTLRHGLTPGMAAAAVAWRWDEIKRAPQSEREELTARLNAWRKRWGVW